MPDVMSLSANVAVNGGPTVSLSSSFVLAGYDVTTIAVEAETAVTMSIQPGKTDEVRVLTVTASRYDPADLTYDLGGVSGMVLDGAHLFTSVGMLPKFTTDPVSITVHNDLTEAVTVNVLVGRVPPPPA
jgi:hypothetical protein